MRQLFIAILLFMVTDLRAQFVLGTTGGLLAPTSEMQVQGTVMLGGNFLNEQLTPQTFTYNTYNYYLNATLFSFFEFAYTCTLFKATDDFVPKKKGKFVNQDRSFSARIRIFSERKYRPALVIGSNDIYTQSGGGQLLDNRKGNKYFNRFYLVVGKRFNVGDNLFGMHLGGIYSSSNFDLFKALTLNVNYTYRKISWIRWIGELYNGDFIYGFQLTPWKHCILTAVVQKGYYVSGGISFRLFLKK